MARVPFRRVWATRRRRLVSLRRCAAPLLVAGLVLLWVRHVQHLLDAEGSAVLADVLRSLAGAWRFGLPAFVLAGVALGTVGAAWTLRRALGALTFAVVPYAVGGFVLWLALAVVPGVAVSGDDLAHFAAESVVPSWLLLPTTFLAALGVWTRRGVAPRTLLALAPWLGGALCAGLVWMPLEDWVSHGAGTPPRGAETAALPAILVLWRMAGAVTTACLLVVVVRSTRGWRRLAPLAMLGFALARATTDLCGAMAAAEIAPIARHWEPGTAAPPSVADIDRLAAIAGAMDGVAVVVVAACVGMLVLFATRTRATTSVLLPLVVMLAVGGEAGEPVLEGHPHSLARAIDPRVFDAAELDPLVATVGPAVGFSDATTYLLARDGSTRRLTDDDGAASRRLHLVVDRAATLGDVRAALLSLPPVDVVTLLGPTADLTHVGDTARARWRFVALAAGALRGYDLEVWSSLPERCEESGHLVSCRGRSIVAPTASEDLPFADVLAELQRTPDRTGIALDRSASPTRDVRALPPTRSPTLGPLRIGASPAHAAVGLAVGLLVALATTARALRGPLGREAPPPTSAPIVPTWLDRADATHELPAADPTYRSTAEGPAWTTSAARLLPQLALRVAAGLGTELALTVRVVLQALACVAPVALLACLLR